MRAICWLLEVIGLNLALENCSLSAEIVVSKYVFGEWPRNVNHVQRTFILHLNFAWKNGATSTMGYDETVCKGVF